MAFFNWNPGLSVGVAAFDNEHLGLVALINDLHDNMRAGKGKDVLGAIMVKLLAYTDTHFEHEESELKKQAYPQFRQHCAQHQKLKRQVDAFRKRLTFDRNGLMVIELAQFLKTWLQGHILHEDMDYKDFLNNKGVR